MTIVRKLLRGSFEIDGMKSDIKEVISMLDGLMDKVGVLDGMSAQFANTACTWKYSYSPNLKRTEVVCFVRGEGASMRFAAQYRIPQEQNHPSYCKTEFVKAVHEALPFFVEGMLKEFPILQGGVKPFLDAAARK